MVVKSKVAQQVNWSALALYFPAHSTLSPASENCHNRSISAISDVLPPMTPPLHGSLLVATYTLWPIACNSAHLVLHSEFSLALILQDH